MEGVKYVFKDTDGGTRWYIKSSKILFMPYNIEPEDYGDIAKDLVSQGYTVQLEII